MKRYAKPQTTKAEIDEFVGRKLNLSQFLFDKQLAFVEDPEPFKVAVCSRRAGKTISCAAHLLYTAINTPDVICLYITLSARNAKRIIWKELTKINRDYKLGGAANDIEMSLTFKNGSVVYASGAKDAGEIEKFRGLPIKLCYIDECQSFREYIKELIDDIIGPALIDYAGTLCLIGTPGPIPTGYFYECAVTSNVWSKHYWTFWDNPHIALKSNKTHQELLDRELKRRGVLMDDPSIQREWFGKWVLDSDALLLHYDTTKNDYDSLPVLPNNAKWNHIMGVDIGFNDADALCILAWSEHDPNTYLVEEIVQEKQDITSLIEQVSRLETKYSVHKIVMDMGGLGKKIGEEMSRRYKIPVEPAEKSRKMENIALLDDALRTGRLKAKPNSKFAQDTYLVEIDRDKTKPDRLVVSDRYHSDIIDAVLYAFKVSPAYTYERPKDKPQRGTKEWAEQQQSSMFEAEMEGMQQEIEHNKLLRGDWS